MNAHTLCAEAMDSLHSSGMDERRAAAEFLRCSRTATSSDVDREESSFVRELNSFFGEWFSIADTACGVPSTAEQCPKLPPSLFSRLIVLALFHELLDGCHGGDRVSAKWKAKKVAEVLALSSCSPKRKQRKNKK